VELRHKDIYKGSYKLFPIRLPENLKKEIEKISEIRGVSMAYFIKEACYRDLRRWEKLLNERNKK
jgi:predicted DNA-binding protein